MLLFFFPPSDLNLTNWNYILSIRYLCQALKWQLICILKLLETCFSEKPIGCRNNCWGRIKSKRTWWSLPWSSLPCKHVKQILRNRGLEGWGEGRSKAIFEFRFIYSLLAQPASWPLKSELSFFRNGCPWDYISQLPLHLCETMWLVGHVTSFWPMECGQKRCGPLLGLDLMPYPPSSMGWYNFFFF